MANNTFRQRINEAMRGRYGSDELGTALAVGSLVLVLINLMTKAVWLSGVALVMALVACWRISSKNLTARRTENDAFLRLVAPVARWVSHPKDQIAERKNYKHLSCPNCGKRMRVPRGKGKMRVTCPSCHTKFDARS